MPDVTPSKDFRFFSAFQRPAMAVLMVVQMLLGLALFLTFVLKFYFLVASDLDCVEAGRSLGNMIRCRPTLEIAAHFLFAMAGFRIAAFMFADHIRTVLGPVMLTLCGTLLLFLNQLTPGASTWAGAATVVTLMIGISAIYAAQVALRRSARPGPGTEPSGKRDGW